MLPDRVSNPGPLTYESGALPIALRGPARLIGLKIRKLLFIPLRYHFLYTILILRLCFGAVYVLTKRS